MLNQKLHNNKLIIITLSLILVFLASCSQAPHADPKNETFSFTDALGREVCVSKNPSRVAALIGSFADVWLLSGGEICATADDAWEDFGLDLGDALNIGTAHSPGLELLLSANPDFVLASASTASNVDMKQSLENAGITVAYFDVDSFDDYLHMLDICTNITGRKDLYEKNGLSIKQEIEKVKNEVSSANIAAEKKKILLLRTSSGSLKAKDSTGTILGEMLSDLGCTNIADNDKNLLENLSVENIIKEEPYHIFVVTMGNKDKALENLWKTIDENPAWSSLEAIRENRLHVMDKKLFNLKPNAEWAKSYEILGEILIGQ